ncbi:MAG: serine hydrolase, partial [Candidatus Latescibacterota bacterium]
YQFLQEHNEVFTERPPVDASEAFAADVRDTSTPEAMVQLLEAILHSELLSEQSSALLVDIMRRCETGESRLRGRLPEATVLAHKTGTIPGVAVNDVGIVTLPGDQGQVVLSVFVTSRGNGDFIAGSDAEIAISNVARAVYDFALFAR